MNNEDKAEENVVEGLKSFLGKSITLYCLNYIYTGAVVYVDGTCVKLAEPHIVYETGKFSDPGWKDAQRLPGKYHYVQNETIESFGDVK